MHTDLLAYDQPGALYRAATLLAAGSSVALPTETVYGLAANALDAEAAAGIFEAKGRPRFDPLIVHLPDRDWLDRLTVPSPLAETLADRFWPGPLTLLVARRPGAVPDLVTAGSPLVAVRISAHPVFAEVIRRFGGPLAAPSANRFGRISPTRAADAMEELSGRIPLVIDGGPTDHGVESTIVEVDPRSGLVIRRPGPVTQEMLAEFGEVRAAAENERIVPGELPGHYAPRTPLRLLASGARLPRGNVGLLGFRRDRPPTQATHTEWLSEHGDLREAAARLFGAMRRLDASGAELIVGELAPESGLGRAINDRLRRAAAGTASWTTDPDRAKLSPMNPVPVEVLIVEDNPDDLALTMMAFRKGKLANDIVVARDGVEALDFLFGRGEHEGRDTSRQPKVILLDLKLPRIDGHEVLRAIRESPLTQHLPVIVMTSSDQDRDVIESYELNVNSYVVKPVSFDRFHEAVTQVGMYWLLLNHPPVAPG